MDETQNSNEPCTDGATAAHTAGTSFSGASQAAEGTKEVEFDTRALNTGRNFAVCYSREGQVGSEWLDSGIRVTVAHITSLTYNDAQPGTAATGQYKRVMDSSNVCYIDGVRTCSDAYPLATNRIPAVPTELTYEYTGNVVPNPVSIGGSIAPGKFLAFVRADLANTPCADRQIATASADDKHSGKLSRSRPCQ